MGPRRIRRKLGESVGSENWEDYKNHEMYDVRKMRDALLKQGDHNVIILDWLNASGPPYTQVVFIFVGYDNTS